MLKQFPTLSYVLQKGFWYLLTFIVAVAINFTLPRLGENNPVDIIMGKAAQGLSPDEAKKKKESLLISFGMAELNEDGTVKYEAVIGPNGQPLTENKPLIDESGNPIVKMIPVLDASGKPLFEKTPLIGDDGKPLTQKVPVLDENGNPVKKKGKVVEEILPVMKEVAVEKPDTLMQSVAVLQRDPKLASGLSQFFVYIKNVFRGDFGLSYSQYPKPVIDIIKESLPWTIAIQLPTIILGWIIGNLLGAFAAYKRGIFDKVFFPLAMFLNEIGRAHV